LEIAATIPDRIAGIILIEASMAASGDPLSARRLTDQFIAEQGFASFLEIRFGEMFLCKNDQYYSILARAKLIDPEGGSALFASQAAWDAGFMERRLSDVKAPLLYIQSMYFDKSGKRRPVSEGCDSPWLDFVASVTPHARIELVTGSGHFPHIEQPEAIVKLIEDFLDSL
jgi:pimeloyl-ACP methyl ester carboxylesterase